MREYPKKYQIYKHFKGNLYEIEGLAEHSETGEMLVIYRALYEHARIYARPLDNFMSRVDMEKYREAGQTYRFELCNFSSGMVQDAKEEKLPEKGGAEEGVQLTATEFVDEEVVHPALLQFLEAESYEEKLDVLISIHGEIDDSLINTIAMSLDIELPPEKESLEEKYESVKNCLVTLEKYECNRLR